MGDDEKGDAETWNKPTTLHFRFKRDRNKFLTRPFSREEKSNGKSGAGKTRKGKERKARKAAAASLERKRRMERERERGRV